MKVFVRNQGNLEFDVDGNIDFNVVALDKEFHVFISKHEDNEITVELLPYEVVDKNELSELEPKLFKGKDFWKFFCASIGSAIQFLVTGNKDKIDPCFYYKIYTEVDGDFNQIYLKLEEGYFLNSKGGFDFVPNMDMWY